ncbi:MAG: FHA domain-containing protein [Lachnospiraceae bacterium]|nr:FHA domain-containing protein [Lachnospiraceae bacterium]
MNRKYVREINKTYLAEEKPENSGRYAYRMLLENRFCFLLNCESRILDGKEKIYYDVTGMNCLADLCASVPLSRQMLTELFCHLKKAREELEAYLLDEAGICLDARCIYYSLSQKEFRFLYLPGSFPEGNNALSELAEFIVQRIDHAEPEGVEKAYRIYEEVWTKGADLSVLLEMEGEDTPSLKQDALEEETMIDPKGVEEYEETYREAFRKGEAQRPVGTDPQEIFSQEKLVTPQKLGALFRKYGLFAFLGLGGVLYGMILWLFSLTLTEQILLPAFLLAGMAGLYFLARYQLDKKEEEAQQEAIAKEKLRLARLAVEEEEMENLREAGEEEEHTVFLGAGKEKRYYLVDLGGQDGERIMLTRFPFQIGKSREVSDHILSDPAVSRLHARFGKTPGGDITVTDLGSLNQTYVNGLPLDPYEERVLELSDEIQIGRTTFQLRASFA